mmetsp:Transcript_12338/g.30177  ORF Transcript_12338/g.30177 Transcript_12338/m.30177 type:complete len:95 (+) Transcript_12338:105-389(+)
MVPFWSARLLLSVLRSLGLDNCVPWNAKLFIIHEIACDSAHGGTRCGDSGLVSNRKSSNGGGGGPPVRRMKAAALPFATSAPSIELQVAQRHCS